MSESPCEHIEKAIVFACAGERLVGVVGAPRHHCRDTGVMVVVGGPQYRAGSHRHFVELARALSDRGWPTLRFDVRGMGDSSGQLQGFERISPDIGSALVAFFQEVPGLQRVVLWGLCDAASAALLYLDETSDPRVAGLVLLNPWVRAPQTYARAQVRQYYTARLFSVEMWRSLLRGRMAMSSIADFLRTSSRALRRPTFAGGLGGMMPYQARMARGWLRFRGPSLLVLSGRDLTAQEFVERSRSDPMLANACGGALVTTQAMPEADHTLSHSSDSIAHLEALCAWLERWLGDSSQAGQANATCLYHPTATGSPQP